MFWIILTGILTGGAIPILALIGWCVQLFVNIFTFVSWGYWQCAGIGFLFAMLFGGIRITIR